MDEVVAESKGAGSKIVEEQVVEESAGKGRC
jgi:hypothetical protein